MCTQGKFSKDDVDGVTVDNEERLPLAVNDDLGSKVDDGLSNVEILDVFSLRKDFPSGFATPKRLTHNLLEKQRRKNLRELFVNLRDLIPNLSKKDKTAKIQIITQAREYINELTEEQFNLTQKVGQEQKRNEELLRKVELYSGVS